MEIGGDEGNLLVIMPAAEWTNSHLIGGALIGRREIERVPALVAV